jgi:CRP-like cAMP-binding protein
MEPLEVLQSVELFEGLTEEELHAIGAICESRTFQSGETITVQGEYGDELYIIHDGFVEVLRSETPTDPSPRAVVNLGRGQIIGEMALVDRGPRSATVKAVTDTTRVQVIHRDQFERLCEKNYHLGYVVLRNIAADLSFKVRHSHRATR